MSDRLRCCSCALGDWLSVRRGHAGLAAGLFLLSCFPVARMPAIVAVVSGCVCFLIAIQSQPGGVQTGTGSGVVHHIATNTEG